jgi:hypothetical protein
MHRVKPATALAQFELASDSCRRITVVMFWVFVSVISTLL